LSLICAALTHALKAWVKTTFTNLNIPPIDAGSQKCTQGTPPVEDRNSKEVKMKISEFILPSKNLANQCVELISTGRLNKNPV